MMIKLFYSVIIRLFYIIFNIKNKEELMNRQFTFKKNFNDEENQQEYAPNKLQKWNDQKMTDIMRKYQTPFGKNQRNTNTNIKNKPQLKDYPYEMQKPLQQYPQNYQKKESNMNYPWRQNNNKSDPKALEKNKVYDNHQNRMQNTGRNGNKDTQNIMRKDYDYPSYKLEQPQKDHLYSPYEANKGNPKKYSENKVEKSFLERNSSLINIQLERYPKNKLKTEISSSNDNYYMNNLKADLPYKKQRIQTEAKDENTHSQRHKQQIVYNKQKENQESKEYNTRINNISKINEKIRKILQNNDNCQEDTYTDIKISKGVSVSPLKMQNRKASLIINKSFFQEGSKINQKRLNINDKTDDNKNDQEQSSNKRQQQSKQRKAAIEEIKNRSKSCLNLNKKKGQLASQQTKGERYQKISEQIQKFNCKINYFKEQKKKLNINFDSICIPSQHNLKQKNHGQNQKESKLEKELYWQEAESHQSVCPDTFIEHNSKENVQKAVKIFSLQTQMENGMQKRQIMQDEHSFTKNKVKYNKSPYIDLKNLQTPDESIFQQEQSINNAFIQAQSFRNDITERLQTRKKKLIDFEKEFNCQKNNTIRNFIRILSEQVQLDQKFRKTKNWFVNCSIKDKLIILQQVLSQRWRQMNSQEIWSQFSVNFEEEDPFYSFKDDQYTLQDMINNYIICNKHWKQKIQSSINMSQHGDEILDSIDVDKKGYIMMEDLVRVINMNQGTYYRNRDIYLIFKRLKQKDQDNEEEYLQNNIFSSILNKK